MGEDFPVNSENISVWMRKVQSSASMLSPAASESDSLFDIDSFRLTENPPSLAETLESREIKKNSSRHFLCSLWDFLLFSLQYFVFDFHVPPDVMFDKIIKLSVSILTKCAHH